MTERKDQGTSACLCPRQRNNKQLLFNNEKKQKPSFRKRARHSCTTFSRPPDPLERKEDLREDTESQCLFPAMSKRRRKKRNKTKQERRPGWKDGGLTAYARTHKHTRTNEHSNTNVQMQTHVRSHADVYTHSYYYPRRSINGQRLQPGADGCYLHYVRSAGVTNKKSSSLFSLLKTIPRPLTALMFSER